MGTNMTACNGAALAACLPGWTGPSCAWPCERAECGFASYCHGDGRTWGLASFGARLFEAQTSLPDQALHALFEQFIVAHPEQVGLEPGISAQDLDLAPARVFRAPAGKLVVLRFDQRYRGIPVYGPDGTVRVTLAPGGAIAFDGAIVDGRQAWANLERHASAELARASILAHAAERSGLPMEELELAGLHRVAVPRVQRIGWVGTVRSGLSHVVTIVVDADAGASFPLSILHAERAEAAGLVDEVDLSVLAEDPASDAFNPPDETGSLAQLFDASPLRGSTRGAEVIVGTERVVGYDVSAAMSLEDIGPIPPLASATTDFDAMPGTVAYDVQNHYVRAQSYYSFVDEYMAGVWDSMNVASSFPPGEFAPRVMLWILPGFEICPMQSYCVNYIPLEEMLPGDVAAEYQQPLNGPALENLAYIAIEVQGTPTHVLAHEFGHVIDLFAAPNFVDSGLGCTGAPGCAPSCQLDTSEEAPTLKEAVAQIFAIAATSALYPLATSDNCDALFTISLGGDGAPHNDTCRPGGEPYSHFLEPPCPPGTGACDHDFGMGMVMGQPTGLCSVSVGYRIDSLHQAFWEIFHGESCAATAPYTCTPMNLPVGMSASDAFLPAFLYALRVDAKSFRQLVDAFATHVSCNLGADVYEEVNAVLCHHDLRVCDAPPPVICEMCNNGVREGSESCDGDDFGGASCEGFGFSGGVLVCDASCMIDTSMCEAAHTGADVTGATAGPDATGMGTTGGDATGSDGGNSSGGGGGGCGCRAGSGRGAGFATTGLGLLGLFGARRPRRRNGAGVGVLAVALVSSLAQGCCDPAVSTDTSVEGDSSTTNEGGSAESTGDPALPQWAIGIFSGQSDKVGMSFSGNLYWWSNVEFTAAGMLFFDLYSCSEHQERQEFHWTLDDDGRRLTVEATPPADVFTFGNGHQVSAVVVEPGETCDTIVVSYFHAEAMMWVPNELQRGNVCATTAPGADSCTFTFEWCDGVAPPACE
jgi:hypothetical protein